MSFQKPFYKNHWIKAFKVLPTFEKHFDIQGKARGNCFLLLHLDPKIL